MSINSDHTTWSNTASEASATDLVDHLRAMGKDASAIGERNALAARKAADLLELLAIQSSWNLGDIEIKVR